MFPPLPSVASQPVPAPSERVVLHSPLRHAVRVALALAALVASACSSPDVDAAGTDTSATVLVRAVARLDRPEFVTLSGEVVAWRTVNVGFMVPGLVQSVRPREGEIVQQGEVVAELEPTDYALNVEMAAAQQERAENEAARVRTMYAEKSVSENDLHKAEIAVRMARAQANMARKKLADSRIAAPLSGVLARRGVEPGEQSGPGMPAFTIVQVNPVQVRVGVPESEIARFAVGQTATATIPSLGGATFIGRVRTVGVVADPASRTYTVQAEIANPLHRMRPGMIAEVRVENGGKVSALVVPAESVVRDVDGVTRVFVYDPKEKRVHARRVDVGAAYGTEIEIRQGLAVNELVVTGGQHRVRDGARVAATVEVVPALKDDARGAR